MKHLPAIGLGTWQNTEPEQCANSVQTAIENGYRHIDTAQYYGNEEAVGKGIESADADREEVFIATKVHAEKFGLAYDEVIEGLQASLKRLELEKIDLLYIHWPVGNYNPEETMPAMDELRQRGLIDHIGVCNFDATLLDEAINHLESPLFAHQAETHPLLPQDELLTHAQNNNYYYVAYSPLARGNVFDINEITTIADKRNLSPPQVALAWLLSKKNVGVIPKATGVTHITDNHMATDVVLTDDEISAIDAIDRNKRFVEREGAPWLV